jgi:hypothetical protein
MPIPISLINEQELNNITTTTKPLKPINTIPSTRAKPLIFYSSPISSSPSAKLSRILFSTPTNGISITDTSSADGPQKKRFYSFFDSKTWQLKIQISS